MGNEHVIVCKEFEKVYHSTIARFISDSLHNLRLCNDTFYKKILVFFRNAAPYIVKAAKPLKVLYPNFIHVTYLDQAPPHVS